MDASVPRDSESVVLGFGAKVSARKAFVRSMLSALNRSCAELLRGSYGSSSP